MSLLHRLVLPTLTIFGLGFLVACGSSSNTAVAPPTGGFTDSDLSGTYVFSLSGTDYTSTASESGASFFAIAGALSATPSSGSKTNGTLSGTIDIVDPELGAVLGVSGIQTGVSTSGTYTIGADGRGTGTMLVTLGTTQFTFGLDFVMTSTSHGLITRFDQYGTGSGTIDAAASGVSQSALGASYTFALGGAEDTTSEAPFGAVGTFALSSTGAISSGVADYNAGGDAIANQAISTSSTLTIGSSATSAGTARLVTGVSGFPSLTFDVWTIDSTHLKLIETDGTELLVGDAYASSGQSFPTSGTLAFTMSGYDDSSSGPLALGGLLTTSSGLLSGVEDVNDFGSVGEAPSVSGTAATSAGRTVISVSGFYNGGWPNLSPSTAGSYTFAAYPFTYNTGGVGVVLLEIDSAGGVTAGTAYLQTTTLVAASQGYGLNLSGLFLEENEEGETVVGGEADMIAEFTATSTDITGLYDVNNAGATISSYWFGDTANPGTYSVGTSPAGRGSATVPMETNNNANAVLDGVDLEFYTVDGSNVIFIETDSGQIATGTFQKQNATGTSSSAALPHFSMVRAANPTAKRQRIQRRAS